MGLGILIQPNPDTTSMDMWACCNMDAFGFCAVATTMEISQDEIVSQGIQNNYDYWIDYSGQGITDPTPGMIYQLNNPSGYPFLFTANAGVIINQNSDPTSNDRWACIVIDSFGIATVTAMVGASYNDLVSSNTNPSQYDADFWVDVDVSGQSVNMSNVYDIPTSTFTPATPDATVRAAFTNLHTVMVAALTAFQAAEPNRSWVAYEASYDDIQAAGGFVNADEQALWTSITAWIQNGGT